MELLTHLHLDMGKKYKMEELQRVVKNVNIEITGPGYAKLYGQH